MKFMKNKKTLSAIAVVTLIAIIGTAVLLQSQSVWADRRLPGLDTLIQEKTEATGSFQILEIAEQGQIGFYFDGNEPFGVDEEGYALSFEEALSLMASKEERQTYLSDLLTRLEGKYGTDGSEEEKYPLSYQTYEEAYFTDETDWTRVDFEENRYEPIPGHYEEVEQSSDGETVYGDYSKNGHYQVAYDEETGSYNGDYVENLAGFDVDSATPSYQVNFGTTQVDEYAALGVYKAEYEVTGVVYNQDAFESLKEQNGGIYWLKLTDGSYTEIDLKDYVFEESATEEEQKVIQADTNLYTVKYRYAGAASDGSATQFYYVQSYEYAFNGWEYSGNYGSLLKVGEEQYVKCEDGKGTHKLSEYDYSYTPGMGNYNFVEDENEDPVYVEIDRFYYKGGFTNHNWFRKDVFLSSEDNINLNLFPVSVRTLTPEQLFEACATDVSLFHNIDLLVIDGESTLFDKGETEITEQIAETLRYQIAREKLPVMVNRAIVDGQGTSKIIEMLKEFYTSSKKASIGSVDSNLYWFTGDILNTDFANGLTKEDAQSGFQDVIDYITTENKYLELREETLLSEDISQAVVIQYILSCKYARNVVPKDTLTVLEIEPCADYVLDAKKVKTMTGYDTLEESQIEIVQMTTAEFVGKIHDLNGVYDFIYLGMETGLMNTNVNTGETIYNDSSMNGLVYTHTGDAVIAAERLTGLLDTDFVDDDRSNLPYSREVYKIRTVMEAGKLILNPEQIQFYINNPGEKEVSKVVTLGNQGVYRYSGNDITSENVEQLLDYVNAGYPLILDPDFAVEGTTNDTLSGDLLNTDKVDNSSYLYEFLEQSVGKNNVLLNTTALSTDPDFAFYMNLPKLHLTFYKEANEGSDTNYYIEDTSITEHYVDENEKFVKKEDGSYYLNYVFSITDEASASTLDTRYQVSVFVDINADGKYSREHEKMQDIKVVKAKDQTPVAVDELKAGEIYLVTRRIPDAFRSIVSWKLEVSLTEDTVLSGSVPEQGETETTDVPSAEEKSARDNDLSLIRKSQLGYSKLEATEKTKIKIYQILSDVKANNRDNNTWNLAEDYANKNGDFYKDVSSLEEYDLDFTSVTVANYQKPKGEEFQSTQKYYDTIKEYDMLILGFADVYEGFTNKYAVEAILQFIESGKSVLFAHDTTSFVNYAGGTADNIAGESQWKDSIFSFLDNSDTAIGGTRWGYLLNQIVRDKLGMDRYGITNAEAYMERGSNTSEGQTKEKTAVLSTDEAKYLLENLLKQGKILESEEKVSTYIPDTYFTGTVEELIQMADKEAAYVAKTGRKQIYPETQGYSYMALNSCVEHLGENEKTVEVNGKKITTGTYTKYKNLNSESGIDNLGKTWADSFRDFFGISSGSSNNWFEDLLNSLANFFGELFDAIFGKIHNGSFDTMEISCVNQGQITEYPFKIGESVAVSSTHAQYYQLDFEADQDQDGESDIVVWYTIADGYNGNNKGKANPYSASPNDVRNNYYIYSIGNVFYTGAGHKEVNRDEKRLFINTMVAAYNAAVNEPSVTVLESENIYAAELSSINLPVEYSLADQTDNRGYIGNSRIEIPFSVYDDNFVYASDSVKKLSVEYFVEDSSGTEVINGVRVKPLENVKTTQNGSAVSQLKSGNAYTAVWTPGSDELYSYLHNHESFKIYVRVKAEFMYNGEMSTLYGYDTLALKKTNLFELD